MYLHDLGIFKTYNFSYNNDKQISGITVKNGSDELIEDYVYQYNTSNMLSGHIYADYDTPNYVITTSNKYNEDGSLASQVISDSSGTYIATFKYEAKPANINQKDIIFIQSGAWPVSLTSPIVNDIMQIYW